MVDPLPNYCNLESGMDIDLARVTVAAFCFWVAWDLLSRLGWRPGGCSEGKAVTVGNLASSVKDSGLTFLIPIPQPNFTP